MLIKHQERLKSKHPNYEEEIGLIKEVVDTAVAVLNTDLSEVAESLDYNWNWSVKNYLFSGQPKEIHCNIPNEKGGRLGYSELFDKGGKFSTSVNHPAILSAITQNDFLDEIGILLTGIYQITFRKAECYHGRAHIEAQNGTPVLISYELTIE